MRTRDTGVYNALRKKNKPGSQRVALHPCNTVDVLRVVLWQYYTMQPFLIHTRLSIATNKNKVNNILRLVSVFLKTQYKCIPLSAHNNSINTYSFFFVVW